MLAILFSRLDAGLVPEHDVAEESAPVADLNSQGVAGRLEDASIDDSLDYTNGQLTYCMISNLSFALAVN